MNGEELREARLRRGWTQQQAAARLGITQAYLSMAEHGRRVLPPVLARKAVEVLHASPTALPLREGWVSSASDSDKLRSELAGLGYPGIADVRGRVRHNPAEVLLTALHQSALETRCVEGSSGLCFTHGEL